MNPVDARYLLSAIAESRYKRSKWEADFLASINEWISIDKFLTKKQVEALQNIYRKSQGGY